MKKTIDIEILFYEQYDSYGVIDKSKEAELVGYKYVFVNDLVTRLSIKYFMYMVVTLSIKNKQINEILYAMKNTKNWVKKPNERFYDFKLL